MPVATPANSVGNHFFGRNTFGRTEVILVVGVDDDRFFRQSGKFAERLDYILKALKIIKMVGVNVKDNRNRGLHR